MERADSRSRTTRSRSRSMHPSNGTQAAPAANGHHAEKHAARSSGRDEEEDRTVPASAAPAHPRKQLSAAAAAPAAAARSGEGSGLSAAAMALLHVPTGNGRKNACNVSSEQEFFWCEGEPTLRKVSAHLDTLTASEQQLRAAHSSLAESFSQLNGTVGALLDSNQRLRRELRAQKTAWARRWLWGGLALIAFTVGIPALRSLAVTCVWSLEHPSDAWPLLLSNLAVMSAWMWLAAFPLVLALFVHAMLTQFTYGRFSLTRTLLATGLGLLMQLPLLYFLMRFGSVTLATLQKSPPFAGGPDAAPNQALTILVWLGMALLDYTLIVMHYYIDN